MPAATSGVYLLSPRAPAPVQLFSFSTHGVGEMEYLMYCIFSKKDASRINKAPVGIGGGPTYVVEENDLSAVVSRNFLQ